MNAMVMDTAYRINVFFNALGSAIYRGLIRTGRARAARELERQGYFEEAKRLIQENQKEN